MRQFMLCAFLAAALPVLGSAAATPAPAPTMVAYVGQMSGSVMVQLAGSEIWSMVKLGEALPGGAKVKTVAGASVTVVAIPCPAWRDLVLLQGSDDLLLGEPALPHTVLLSVHTTGGLS